MTFLSFDSGALCIELHRDWVLPVPPAAQMLLFVSALLWSGDNIFQRLGIWKVQCIYEQQGQEGSILFRGSHFSQVKFIIIPEMSSVWFILYTYVIFDPHLAMLRAYSWLRSHMWYEESNEGWPIQGIYSSPYTVSPPISYIHNSIFRDLYARLATKYMIEISLWDIHFSKVSYQNSYYMVVLGFSSHVLILFLFCFCFFVNFMLTN